MVLYEVFDREADGDLAIGICILCACFNIDRKVNSAIRRRQYWQYLLTIMVLI